MLKMSLNYLNNMLEEEKVRVRSKRKYTCKRNRGEHEYLEPVIVFKPMVRYLYETDRGILDSRGLHPEYKYLRTEIHLITETRCKHCGHKALSIFTDKIK